MKDDMLHEHEVVSSVNPSTNITVAPLRLRLLLSSLPLRSKQRASEKITNANGMKGANIYGRDSVRITYSIWYLQSSGSGSFFFAIGE